MAIVDKAWSSTAPPGEFRPYVPAEESLAEFTLRAVVLGALFGLLFGLQLLAGLIPGSAGVTLEKFMPSTAGQAIVVDRETYAWVIDRKTPGRKGDESSWVDTATPAAMKAEPVK